MLDKIETGLVWKRQNRQRGPSHATKSSSVVVRERSKYRKPAAISGCGLLFTVRIRKLPGF
jgi:hypothetical protein